MYDLKVSLKGQEIIVPCECEEKAYILEKHYYSLGAKYVVFFRGGN